MAWKNRPTGYARQVEQEQNKRLRATALQAFTGILERSPVDTGAFRGNNVLSVGSREDGYTLDATGDYNQQQADARLSRVTSAFEVIYVQNNLPYAETIEFGGFTYKPAGKTTPAGYSIQAPKGVYSVTFNNLREATR